MFNDFEFDDFDTQIQPEELFIDSVDFQDDEVYEADEWPYDDEPEPQGFEFYDDYNDGEWW